MPLIYSSTFPLLATTHKIDIAVVIGSLSLLAYLYPSHYCCCFLYYILLDGGRYYAFNHVITGTMIDDSYGNRDGSGRVIRYLVERLIFNCSLGY